MTTYTDPGVAAHRNAPLRLRLTEEALLRWVLFVAAMGFAGVLLWDYGYLGYLLTYDTSRISLAIIALFVIFSLYCLWMLISASQELAAVDAVSAALEQGASLHITVEQTGIGGLTLPRHLLVSELLRDVALKQQRDAAGSLQLLLESFAAQLRVPGRRGIFVSDLMYKLGMLGTVIGFVVMLVSLRDLGNFEIEAMRDALQQMTEGMAVALLTTITGLVCGVLLRVQFNLLDSLSMQVLRRTVRMTELFLRPVTATE